jgi:hypothetical protein
MLEILQNFLARAHTFGDEARRILAKHEAAVSRVITVEDTYRTLTGLSLHQDELFREALECVEKQLLRAAHVMAWAGFMDYLEEKMMSEYLAEIKAARPKWSISSIEDLREQATEYQLIEVCREVKLLGKNEGKALLGLLNKRNECAHPSNYAPGLNETLGFISELLSRINTLQLKPRP